MPFTKGHPFYRSHKPGAYAPRKPPSKDRYEKIDYVPDVKWKPAPWAGKGPPRKEPTGWPWIDRRRERARRPLDQATTTLLSTPGEIYKLVRVRATGEVTYYKLRDAEPAATPKEAIDAEPKRAGQVRYRKGAPCWFVDAGGIWYLCKVEDRQPNRIVIRAETGWDSERKVQWPYGDLLEFPCHRSNPMFARLRPLKDKYR